MTFKYYKKLNKNQKQIYNASDRVPFLRIPHADKLPPYVRALKKALESGSRTKTEVYAQKLVTSLCILFKVPKVKIKVLAKRPSKSWGELHGLYELEEGERPVITVWMRTAVRKDVVSYRTFLRTILHEIIHHLDYALLKLEDSFHTEGFYKRESSLLKQLLGE